LRQRDRGRLPRLERRENGVEKLVEISDNSTAYAKKVRLTLIVRPENDGALL
jgi:hypothetical protein